MVAFSRQVNYKSDLYPFACDFYVPDRDLYIEYNGNWTHGKHWFDKNDINDLNTVRRWKERGTPYYLAAIKNWTQYDVLKHDIAIKNRLNYLVFWNLGDVREWIKRFQNIQFKNAPACNDAIEHERSNGKKDAEVV